jgi:hypothetical protein
MHHLCKFRGPGREARRGPHTESIGAEGRGGKILSRADSLARLAGRRGVKRDLIAGSAAFNEASLKAGGVVQLSAKE